jgi:flagellar motor switch/type III secretory pathway protein FliN
LLVSAAAEAVSAPVESGVNRTMTAAIHIENKAEEVTNREPAHELDSIPWLPCTLTLDIPVVRFTIGDLLSLTKGSIVETACHHTSDVPLRVNQLLIGWTEFDVIGDHLAVRITEQA